MTKQDAKRALAKIREAADDAIVDAEVRLNRPVHRAGDDHDAIRRNEYQRGYWEGVRSAAQKTVDLVRNVEAMLA